MEMEALLNLKPVQITDFANSANNLLHYSTSNASTAPPDPGLGPGPQTFRPSCSLAHSAPIPGTRPTLAATTPKTLPDDSILDWHKRQIKHQITAYNSLPMVTVAITECDSSAAVPIESDSVALATVTPSGPAPLSPLPEPCNESASENSCPRVSNLKEMKQTPVSYPFEHQAVESPLLPEPQPQNHLPQPHPHPAWENRQQIHRSVIQAAIAEISTPHSRGVYSHPDAPMHHPARTFAHTIREQQSDLPPVHVRSVIRNLNRAKQTSKRCHQRYEFSKLHATRANSSHLDQSFADNSSDQMHEHAHIHACAGNVHFGSDDTIDPTHANTNHEAPDIDQSAQLSSAMNANVESIVYEFQKQLSDVAVAAEQQRASEDARMIRRTHAVQVESSPPNLDSVHAHVSRLMNNNDICNVAQTSSAQSSVPQCQTDTSDEAQQLADQKHYPTNHRTEYGIAADSLHQIQHQLSINLQARMTNFRANLHTSLQRVALSHTLALQRKEALQQLAVQRFVLQRRFSMWKNYVAAQKLKAHMTQSIMDRKNDQIRMQKFLIWKSIAYQHRQERLKVTMIQYKHFCRIGKHIIQFWARMAKLHAICNVFVGQRRRSMMQHACHLWQRASLKQQLLRSHGAQIGMHRRFRLLRGVLEIWRHRLDTRNLLLSRQMLKSKSRFRTIRVGAFRFWHQRMRMRRQVRVNLIQTWLLQHAYRCTVRHRSGHCTPCSLLRECQIRFGIPTMWKLWIAPISTHPLSHNGPESLQLLRHSTTQKQERLNAVMEYITGTGKNRGAIPSAMLGLSEISRTVEYLKRCALTGVADMVYREHRRRTLLSVWIGACRLRIKRQMFSIPIKRALMSASMRHALFRWRSNARVDRILDVVLHSGVRDRTADMFRRSRLLEHAFGMWRSACSAGAVSSPSRTNRIMMKRGSLEPLPLNDIAWLCARGEHDMAAHQQQMEDDEVIDAVHRWGCAISDHREKLVVLEPEMLEKNATMPTLPMYGGNMHETGEDEDIAQHHWMSNLSAPASVFAMLEASEKRNFL
jgi:hypothetical protein